MNDFDLDGDMLLSLVTVPPLFGSVYLDNDGSFSYMPKTGFNGMDSFKYVVFDGYSLSEENTAYLDVKGNVSAVNDFDGYHAGMLKIYPNPTNGLLNLEAESIVSEILIFDFLGNQLDILKTNSKRPRINLYGYPNGEYIILAKMDGRFISRKIVLAK